MLTALGSGLASIFYGGIFEPLDISWRWLYVDRAATARDAVRPPAAAPREPPIHGRTAERCGSRRTGTRSCVPRSGAGSCSSASPLSSARSRRRPACSRSTSSRRTGTSDRPSRTSSSSGRVHCAIPFLVGSGQLSDRYGRKVVGCSFGVLVRGRRAVVLPLRARRAGRSSCPCSLVFIGQFGSWPTLGAFGSELFPTAHRALAGSWSNVARVAGQSVSFALGGSAPVASRVSSRSRRSSSGRPVARPARDLDRVPRDEGTRARGDHRRGGCCRLRAAAGAGIRTSIARARPTGRMTLQGNEDLRRRTRPERDVRLVRRALRIRERAVAKLATRPDGA